MDTDSESSLFPPYFESNALLKKNLPAFPKETMATMEEIRLFFPEAIFY